MIFTESFNKATRFSNVREILVNSAKMYPNNNAFILKKDITKQEYTYITYEKFLEDINDLGTAFFDMGFKDKRIAICGSNSYLWFLSYCANLCGNIVSVPLDAGLMEGELEMSLIRSKADVLVFDSKIEEIVKSIKEKGNTSIKEYISIGQIEGFKTIDDLLQKGKELREKGNDEYLNVEIENDDMKILLFTSGTTAMSKAVMLSERNIAEDIYAMQQVEKLLPTDVNLAILPFHHAYGSTGVLMMLASGTANVFPDGLKYIAKNMVEYKVSVYVGVPQLIELMYKKIMHEVEKSGKMGKFKKGVKISKFLLKFNIDVRRKIFKEILDGVGGNLRYIVSGASNLDKDVHQGFNDIGVHTVQGYGLSETSPCICSENDKYLKEGSVGKPMPNTEIEIYNPDENGIGEIRIKAPMVFLGYYENEEATKQALRDGWFYTGDLGYIKDDFLYLTGRQKNMIVLKNGKKVFPEEFEALINDFAEVKESMVFGLPQEDGDVMISVKVQYDVDTTKKLYPGKNEDEIGEIIWTKIKELNKTFPKYKYIKKMLLTDEDFIKTTTGKIKRYEEMKKINS